MSTEHDHSHGPGGHTNHKVTTLDLIRRYLSLKIAKMTATKKPVMNPNISPLDQMHNIEINHIAIVIDDTVQDVMRAQNRMAAMLLSEPKFVLFDPKETQVRIGFKYENGKFVPSEKEN